MELYVRYRVYDTGFCDLIPDIMAKVINTPIIIIDTNVSDYNVYVPNPLSKTALLEQYSLIPKHAVL